MKTRNGTLFRIYAVDGRAPYSLHGAVFLDGGWISYEWTAGGFRDWDQTPNELDICDAMAEVARAVAADTALQGVN